MNILVFNVGSSSLNFKIYAVGPGGELTVLTSGKAHRVGAKGTEPAFIQYNLTEGVEKQVAPLPDHRQAAIYILNRLVALGIPFEAIGHRVVHGGPKFHRAAFLNETTMPTYLDTLPMAPLHNPNTLAVYEECRRLWPQMPQYLSFDTAFHALIPDAAATYALPPEIEAQYGLRKYGFHGLSYDYIVQQLAAYTGRAPEDTRTVACHLGTGGSSVAAIVKGRSVDTSMGYTPLAGLMMSTRTGDLDPQATLYAQRTRGLDAQAMDRLFNKNSGLLGVSGLSSDLRDLVQAMTHSGEQAAALAFEMYTYRLRKMIAAYSAQLGGMEFLVFTDDIGVQNEPMRAAVCQGLGWCGVDFDPEANAAVTAGQISEISRPGSPVRVLVIPTDEELVIGRQGVELLQEAGYVHL